MTEIPENLQPENWHRYFAIYANNAAWNMSESLENVLNHTELLDAAHASAWHWRVAGATINQMRSTMLLALIHSRMNMGPSAWRYAESMKKYFMKSLNARLGVALFTPFMHGLLWLVENR
jgi:hypothetical protein